MRLVAVAFIFNWLKILGQPLGEGLVKTISRYD